jgi:hypothetical protein
VVVVVVMSRHDAELRRRLRSGDSFEETACWYLERAAAGDIHKSDMTALEVRFWNDITAAYGWWKAKRRGGLH